MGKIRQYDAVMSKPNPYQSPPDESRLTIREVEGGTTFDKRGMLSVIAATSILVGYDAAVSQLGVFVVYAPPILFFVIANWSVMAATRDGPMGDAKRVLTGILLGLLAAPCFELIFVAGCTPSVNAVGPFWYLDRPADPTTMQRILFFIITAILVAILSCVIFWLVEVTSNRNAVSNRAVSKTDSR